MLRGAPECNAVEENQNRKKTTAKVPATISPAMPNAADGTGKANVTEDGDDCEVFIVASQIQHGTYN